MIIRRLFLLCALLAGAVSVRAQTPHTFPATDTNNAFTGTNTFPNINTILYVDGTRYARSAAGINAASAALSGGAGIVWVPTAGTYSDTVIAVAKNETLVFGGGTFTVAGITVPDSTTDATGTSAVYGQGVDRTTVMLANGKNVDVITDPNFGTLTGGTNFNGVYHTTIADLTINGNKANQSSTSYGIRLYGRAGSIYNFDIVNAYSDGLYVEWGGTENFAAITGDDEWRIHGGKTRYSGGNGLTDKAKSDAEIAQLVTYSNGAYGLETFYSAHTNGINSYLNSTAACRVTSGGSLFGADVICNSAAGYGLVIDTTAGASQLQGNFACSGCVGISIGSQNNFITGQFANSAPAIQFNGSGSNGNTVVGTVYGNTGTLVDWTGGGGGGGDSYVSLTGNGSGTMFTGSAPVGATVLVDVVGVTGNPFQQLRNIQLNNLTVNGTCTGCGSGVTSVSGTTNQIAVTNGTTTPVIAFTATPVLPNGTTATTQAGADNTTKVATDAFVLANAGGGSGCTGYSTTQILFGTGSGSCASTGDAGLVWDNTAKALTVGTGGSGGEALHIISSYGAGGDSASLKNLEAGGLSGFGLYDNTGAIKAEFGWANASFTSPFGGTFFFDTATQPITFSSNNYDLDLGITTGGIIGIRFLDSATSTNLCLGTQSINGTSLNSLAACTSLRAFKKNIHPLLDKNFSALAEVEALLPVRYDPRKPNGFTTGHEIGLIAEDVAKVDTRLSTYDPRTKKLQGVQYDRTGVLAIAAIQELEVQVKELQAEVKELREEKDGRWTVKMATQIPAKVTINPNNDLLFELTGLYDDYDDLFINAAAVTVTLYDQRGNIVPGCSGINLGYVGSSQGDYEGTAPASPFGFQTGLPTSTVGGYTLVVNAVAAGVQYQVSIPAEIGWRRQ